MRLGFAGLGRMGAPMAVNLARAGHDVTVWNRSPGPAQRLADMAGVRVADTPHALADGAEVVLTMLADDPASDAVHRGPDGLFAASGPRILLEMGTMSPAHIRALAADAPDGCRVIDAPVSGATAAAEAAQLMIMLGAEDGTAQQLAPVLAPMSRKVIALGAVGAGAVMKLAVNAMIHSLNQTVSEALMLTDAAGIPTAAAFDAIEASAACAPMLGYRRALYLDEAAQAVTFTVDLAAKDMRVTAELADSLGLAMPQARLNLSKLQDAVAAGFGPRDMASMLNFLREEKT
jgi:3-hydroxyisobutyrate dehydrogenase